MSPFTLENKIMLVTGASSGIGAKTAIEISKAGGKLILTARNEERLANTMSQLNGKGHQTIIADLTDTVQIEHLVSKVPQIDGIVHSSGIVHPYPVQFIGEKQINKLFNINYQGPVILNSKLLRAKKINRNASIVFISSISSQFPHKGGALYSGAKAALNVYSKTVALEYAHKRIRSNVISAAMVKTPLFDQAEKAASSELMAKHGEQYPLGFGESKDIALAAIFLLSNGSKWITGTEILMDGGLTIGQ